MARTAAAALLVLLGAGAGDASARCTASEKREMRDSGLGARRAAELCGAAERQDRGPNDDASDRNQPQPDRFQPFFSIGPMPAAETARACFSLLGRCRMAVHLPVGAPCLCNGHSEPALGEAR